MESHLLLANKTRWRWLLRLRTELLTFIQSPCKEISLNRRSKCWWGLPVSAVVVFGGCDAEEMWGPFVRLLASLCLSVCLMKKDRHTKTGSLLDFPQPFISQSQQTAVIFEVTPTQVCTLTLGTILLSCQSLSTDIGGPWDSVPCSRAASQQQISCESCCSHLY